VIECSPNGRKKVLVVLGTRPEAIKLAPVIKCLKSRLEEFETVVCTTGQHREMLKQVFSVFDLEPEYDLALMQPGQSLSEVTTAVLEGVEHILKHECPDIVLVQGDTTTAFAGALAAYYQRVPVGHVEAGLRTENKYSPFPEEINRRLTTHIAEYHFAPTEAARANLLREGVRPEKILVTGNTVVDALLYIRSRSASHTSHPPKVELEGLNGHRLILVTAHRRESFGQPLSEICHAIRALARRPDVFIVYPVHLNPQVTQPVHDLLGGLPNVKLLAPLDYVSFVSLMDRASILLTDSGGVQEEGPTLGKPVLVMREVSERQEAIAAGAACLVGTNSRQIVEGVSRLLDEPATYERMVNRPNPYGDGNARFRIADFLACLPRAPRV
jgi:UDP-N-acetylglucosamine 2-epimerase (non-hydrolysing)